jgi:hypothetical protein
MEREVPTHLLIICRSPDVDDGRLARVLGRDELAQLDPDLERIRRRERDEAERFGGSEGSGVKRHRGS